MWSEFLGVHTSVPVCVISRLWAWSTFKPVKFFRLFKKNSQIFLWLKWQCSNGNGCQWKLFDDNFFFINFYGVYLFGFFYVAFNTVQVISWRVVGRAEETSTYSSLGFCTVNCRPTASNYQLSHLRPCRESNPGLRGGIQWCKINLLLVQQVGGGGGGSCSKVWVCH